MSRAPIGHVAGAAEGFTLFVAVKIGGENMLRATVFALIAAFAIDATLALADGLDPTGTHLLIAGRILDLATGREVLRLEQTGPVLEAEYSANGSRIVVVSRPRATGSDPFDTSGGVVRVFDASTGRKLFEVDQGSQWRTPHVALSPDGTRLAIPVNGPSVQIWDVDAGHIVLTLSGDQDYVSTVRFSPDGRLIATIDGRKTARVWDAASGAEIAHFQDSDWPIGLYFSPDSAHVLTHTYYVATIWTARSGQVSAVLRGHSGPILSAAFSPNGARVLTTSLDTTARIWDVTTGRPIFALTGHTDGVSHGAFSANGARIITASRDRTARVWDAATGAELALRGYEPTPRSVADPGGGSRLLSNNGDWPWVTGAWLSADGSRATFLLQDGSIVSWDVLNRREARVHAAGHPVANAAATPAGLVLHACVEAAHLPAGSTQDKSAFCRSRGLEYQLSTAGARTQDLITLGRAHDAETLIRAAIALAERHFGAASVRLEGLYLDLGDVLMAQQNYVGAEQAYRRVNSLGPGRRQTDLAYEMSFGRIQAALEAQGRSREARVVGQEHDRLFQNLDGERAGSGSLVGIAPFPGSPERPANIRAPTQAETDDANQRWQTAQHQATTGHLADAETNARAILGLYEQTYGPNHLRTAAALSLLSGILVAEHRDGEAEPFAAREQRIDEALLATPANEDAQLDRYDAARRLVERADSLSSDSWRAERMRLLRLVLPVFESTPQQTAREVVVVMLDISETAREGGDAQTAAQYAEQVVQRWVCPPEPSGCGSSALREAIASLSAQQAPQVAAAMYHLAAATQMLGRIDDAVVDYELARAAAARAGRSSEDVALWSDRNLGRLYRVMHRYDEANAAFSRACAGFETRRTYASRGAVVGDVERVSTDDAAQCDLDWVLSLWQWSATGALAEPDRARIAIRAFAIAQGAQDSLPGAALAKMAARASASSRGAGAPAATYEDAMARREALEGRAAAARGDSQTSNAQRQQIDAQLEAIDDEIARAAVTLSERYSPYWELRAPRPIEAAALQARSGLDAALLGDDEALVMFLIPAGAAHGFVFAVSKERQGWAQIGLSGDEIAASVIALRGDQNADPDAGTAPFDRQLAYNLYRALFGDRAIQDVIANKHTLLIVPDGALTSLPPGLLVTAPPSGDVEGNSDPTQLRRTPWLLRSKAIALLPTPFSLRVLRQILPSAHVAAQDPFLGLVNPDFGAHIQTRPAHRSVVQQIRAYYRDGLPIAEALRALPPLNESLREGRALRVALGGRADSLLTGSRASKAALLTRDADNRLAQVRVLGFATHGLLAGEFDEFAEPALVLASAPTPQDMLLSASDIAALHLNADWVLLSACSTAGPNTPGAPGLSGLARAFFHAGARSVLVSHWSIRDEVAAQLVPAILVAQQRDGLSRARAVQQASLAILDNPDLDAADPRAWAAFTVVGEAGR